MMCSFVNPRLTSPSVPNKYLKIIEYATSEVTHGRKIAVRKNPLNFKLRSLSRTEMNMPSMIIIGT
ncbi:hypothetical protein D3C84_1293340 [compost metagenome]